MPTKGAWKNTKTIYFKRENQDYTCWRMVVKIFFKKKSMLEQIATVVMNYFHSKAGNAWKMVARWAWNENCLVEAAGYHNLEKMITQIS